MSNDNASATEIFRRSTMNRVASSDELDRYIKVTNPSAWVVTIAALLLVVGVFVWAVFAVVPVTVETTGIMTGNLEKGEKTVVCWVDEATADRIRKTGLKASVDGVEAKSAALSDVPMSASEVIDVLGSDFYADAMQFGQWNYLVSIVPGDDPRHSDFTIETPVGDRALVPVSIVTSETRPINIVLGKRG